jgi:hypothetical protein
MGVAMAPRVPAAVAAAVDVSALAPCLEVLRRTFSAAAAAGGSSPALLPAPTTAAAAELLCPDLAFGLLKGDAIRADDLLAVDDSHIWAMRRECAQYGMLCFRGVTGLSAEKFGVFMSRWGRIAHDFDASEDQSLEPSAPPDVAPVIFGNAGDGQHLYTDTGWHFDGEDLPWLHSHTALFCVRPPFVGHTTAFAFTCCTAPTPRTPPRTSTTAPAARWKPPTLTWASNSSPF